MPLLPSSGHIRVGLVFVAVLLVGLLAVRLFNAVFVFGHKQFLCRC